MSPDNVHEIGVSPSGVTGSPIVAGEGAGRANSKKDLVTGPIRGFCALQPTEAESASISARDKSCELARNQPDSSGPHRSSRYRTASATVLGTPSIVAAVRTYSRFVSTVTAVPTRSPSTGLHVVAYDSSPRCRYPYVSTGPQATKTSASAANIATDPNPLALAGTDVGMPSIFAHLTEGGESSRRRDRLSSGRDGAQGRTPWRTTAGSGWRHSSQTAGVSARARVRRDLGRGCRRSLHPGDLPNGKVGVVVEEQCGSLPFGHPAERVEELDALLLPGRALQAPPRPRELSDGMVNVVFGEIRDMRSETTSMCPTRPPWESDRAHAPRVYVACI